VSETYDVPYGMSYTGNAAANSSLVDIELPENNHAHQLSCKQLTNRTPRSTTVLLSYWPIASRTVGEPWYFRTAITSVLNVKALICWRLLEEKKMT